MGAAKFRQGDQALLIDDVAVSASAAELNTMAGIGATAAELNRSADVSARLVTVVAATLTASELLHDGKTVVLSKVNGLAVTLPAATGSGMRLRFVIGLTSTSVGYSIATAPTTDIFAGSIATTDSTDGTAHTWATAADSNKMILGGTANATGGSAGDVIDLEDIAAGIWAVKGFMREGGTEATPFSHV